MIYVYAITPCRCDEHDAKRFADVTFDYVYYATHDFYWWFFFHFIFIDFIYEPTHYWWYFTLIIIYADDIIYADSALIFIITPLMPHFDVALLRHYCWYWYAIIFWCRWLHSLIITLIRHMRHYIWLHYYWYITRLCHYCATLIFWLCAIVDAITLLPRTLHYAPFDITIITHIMRHIYFADTPLYYYILRATPCRHCWCAFRWWLFTLFAITAITLIDIHIDYAPYYSISFHYAITIIICIIIIIDIIIDYIIYADAIDYYVDDFMQKMPCHYAIDCLLRDADDITIVITITLIFALMFTPHCHYAYAITHITLFYALMRYAYWCAIWYYAMMAPAIIIIMMRHSCHISINDLICHYHASLPLFRHTITIIVITLLLITLFFSLLITMPFCFLLTLLTFLDAIVYIDTLLMTHVLLRYYCSHFAIMLHYAMTLRIYFHYYYSLHYAITIGYSYFAICCATCHCVPLFCHITPLRHLLLPPFRFSFLIFTLISLLSFSSFFFFHYCLLFRHIIFIVFIIIADTPLILRAMLSLHSYITRHYLLFAFDITLFFFIDVTLPLIYDITPMRDGIITPLLIMPLLRHITHITIQRFDAQRFINDAYADAMCKEAQFDAIDAYYIIDYAMHALDITIFFIDYYARFSLRCFFFHWRYWLLIFSFSSVTFYYDIIFFTLSRYFFHYFSFHAYFFHFHFRTLRFIFSFFHWLIMLIDDFYYTFH